MSGFHWLVGKVFEASGFHWSVRRTGDIKIGIWRKRLSFARSKKAPRRLVVTPGFGDTPVSWLGIIGMLRPALKRAAIDEVAFLDLPGFNGKLAGEKCVPSMDLLLQAVGDIYDELEPDTILGHSLGGWLAGAYAADCGEGKRPANRRKHGYDGPKRVVLVAPAGVYASTQVADTLDKVIAELVGAGGFSALRPHLFAREPLWFKAMAGVFGRFSRSESVRQFTSSFREDHRVHDRLGNVKAETWLLWGDRDTLTPPSGAQAWLSGLEPAPCEARAWLLHDVGHSPQIEKPVVTAAMLTQILLGRVPSPGRQRLWRMASGLRGLVREVRMRRRIVAPAVG